MASAVPSTSAAAGPAGDPAKYAVGERECLINQCEVCTYTSRSFYRLHDAQEALFRFFYSNGVLPCHYNCPTCGAVLKWNSSHTFRCQQKNKRNKRKCKTHISAFTSSFFFYMHLTPQQIVELVWLYIARSPPRCAFLQQDTGLSTRTLTNWFSFMREVFIAWAVNNSQDLEGEGVVVEIDEAKIGKRKYNRG